MSFIHDVIKCTGTHFQYLVYCTALNGCPATFVHCCIQGNQYTVNYNNLREMRKYTATIVATQGKHVHCLVVNAASALSFQ